MPPSSPLKHIQLVHAHTCAERERKRGGGGGGGGERLWRERERKGKQRGEYNKENTVWSNNTVQWGRQWPEHVFLTVTNSYSSTNPARAFTRCLLPACMCLYGWWHVCACICAHAVDHPVSDRQETEGNRKEEREGGGDKEGGAPHMAVKESDWFSAPVIEASSHEDP